MWEKFVIHGTKIICHFNDKVINFTMTLIAPNIDRLFYDMANLFWLVNAWKLINEFGSPC